VLFAWSTEAHATDYLFHVSCQNNSLVVEWNIGSVDPGKEYLRVATGTKYPNCSVTDYNEPATKPLLVSVIATKEVLSPEYLSLVELFAVCLDAKR
jgi:hypothetical protein